MPGTLPPPYRGVWVRGRGQAPTSPSRPNFEIAKTGFTYGVDCAREFLRRLGVVDVCMNWLSSSNICVESGVVFSGVFF